MSDKAKSWGIGKLVFWGLVLLALYGMGRCGFGLVEGGLKAEAAVTAFHQQLDAGTCDAALAARCTDAHARLGKVTGTKRIGIHLEKGTGAADVLTVTYETRFQRGEAREVFTFIGDRLTDWRIESAEQKQGAGDR